MKDIPPRGTLWKTIVVEHQEPLVIPDAFVEELIDFFPDARARAGLRKVIEAGRKVRNRLLTHAETLLESIDPEAEATKLIASLGNSPASSASTPDPSRSGS